MPRSGSASTRSDFDDHAPPEVSDSDNDEEEYEEVEEMEVEEEENEDDEVEEYEEVEVEVEVDEEEEEEEEEEEVEEVEENDEEDASDSPIEADEDRNDVSQDMESEEHDGLLGSGSSTIEKFEVKLSSDTHPVEESSGNYKFPNPSNVPLMTQKKESCLNPDDSKYIKSAKDLVIAKENGIQEVVVGEENVEALPEERISKDGCESHCDNKDHLGNKEIMDAKTNCPTSLTGMVADAILIIDHSGEEANGVLNSKEENKQMDLQSGDDKKRLASRMAAPDIRTRSLSPGAESNDGNKRPTVICDFFTKGWCIKGSSCRFLHIKGPGNSTSQQLEADVAVENCGRKDQLDEGLRDVTERSRSPGFPEPLASSVGNSLAFSSRLSSERIPPREHGESQSWGQVHGKYKLPLLEKEDISLCTTPNSQQLPSSKDDPGFVSFFKDVGRDSQRQNWLADDYGDHASSNSRGSSIVRNNLLPEYGFSSNYCSGIFSSRSSSMEEAASIQSQHMQNDFTSPRGSHSLNASSKTLPNTDMFPSHRISAWTTSSLPFSYSSFSASPLGAQQLLDSDRECRASRSSSLLRSSPPFFGLESENLPLTNVPLRSAEKTKFSSNDWEPSVPFRPSFFISPTLISSLGSQYDPLRDSIELPKIRDESFKVSPYGQGASILNTSRQRKYGDYVLTGTLGPESNDDTNSVSSRNKVYENVLDKCCYTREKDSLTTEAETAETSFVNLQNGTMPKEENPLGPSHAKDITKTHKVNNSHASSHQNDGSRHKKDLKVSRARQDNEMDIEHNKDGDVQKESKAMRHFRASLVDLVKELLKPTWRDGHLSKDAHNLIVKKAVDKVLSTLQSHQVPTTMELVKQYLSSSRSKIAKLVEGYVDKYGKS